MTFRRSLWTTGDGRKVCISCENPYLLLHKLLVFIDVQNDDGYDYTHVLNAKPFFSLASAVSTQTHR